MDAGANTLTFFMALYVGDAHYVCEHSGCGDACACSVALDQHGVLVVSLSGEKDDVVGALELVEGRTLAEFAERDGIFAVIHTGDDAPVLVLLRKLAAALLKVGVELGKSLPELFQAAAEVILGNEVLGDDVLLLDLVARFAREDDELADDVLAREVDAGIWLKGMSSERVLKMKLSVPLSTASILRILSPLLRRALMVLMMGSPAPTLVSKRNFTPRLRARAFKAA